MIKYFKSIDVTLTPIIKWPCYNGNEGVIYIPAKFLNMKRFRVISRTHWGRSLIPLQRFSQAIHCKIQIIIIILIKSPEQHGFSWFSLFLHSPLSLNFLCRSSNLHPDRWCNLVLAGQPPLSCSCAGIYRRTSHVLVLASAVVSCIFCGS